MNMLMNTARLLLDPGSVATQGISNLISILEAVIKAAGVALGLFGVLQFATSFTQHDAQQRINGFLFLAGGIVCFFAPEILAEIGIVI